LFNSEPNIPDIPSGSIYGKAGMEYSYVTSSTDPNEDDIYYLIDWGDGTDTGWLGSYTSGESICINHT